MLGRRAPRMGTALALSCGFPKTETDLIVLWLPSVGENGLA